MPEENNKYKKEDIIAEYQSSSASKDEFGKVKWGSQEKMLNRFRQIIKELDFASAKSWLDIGSGTGAFQAIVNEEYPQLKCTGIDITQNLIQFAKSRADVNHQKTDFINSDYMDFKSEQYDIITCIGVLQKTNFDVSEFFVKTYSLLAKGSTFLLDTKNLNWEAFKDENFNPEESHRWFIPEELVQTAQLVGFKNLIVKGFIPGENKIVKPNKSHTIFLTGHK